MERRDDGQIGVLHGFRALMIALVANFHIWQQSWWAPSFRWLGRNVSLTNFSYSGFLFVDGMLLLSGFLLYLPWAREKEYGTPVPPAGEFWLKRFCRIVPSYEFAVLASFLLIALPQGLYYGNASRAAEDLAAHVTFLQMFSRNAYLNSPLNGAVWTMVVEMQFYLLFPFLARAARKKPALTLGLMALCGWAYRILVCRFAADTAPLVNQLPAYLDVFALGMLGAVIYVRGRAAAERMSRALRAVLSAFALALFAVSCVIIVRLVLRQTASCAGGYESIRHSQMRLELPFSAAVLAAMLSACAMPAAFRFLLDNPLARFLSGISMNFYVWHQVIAVQIRLRWFPNADALHADPGMQTMYTLLCWLAAFAAAMLVTYGIEKPAAAGLKKLAGRIARGGENGRENA